MAPMGDDDLAIDRLVGITPMSLSANNDLGLTFLPAPYRH